MKKFKPQKPNGVIQGYSIKEYKTMVVTKSFNMRCRLLPYNGSKINFLAKNLKMTARNVFVVLSVINVTSDEFIPFLINERLKNRMRKISIL